ncbi:hypothetical protein CH352_18755 [Leptospira hartskeerlii]|uniref:Uncharacterized protein n=1 Tax=Leptospira hartskeerlii TaxID=2023177 RepID=A0A2M9X895_9LEPT|nr:hypothetical protein CH357_18680 [Leptospira hartskeerlii]PJZ31948.1 hypothetical protein CH352_18755 [Leptospira hartskeerlii]
MTSPNFRLGVTLRVAYAPSLQASPHFALSLVLLSKSRAKCFALAKRRQPLVVMRKARKNTIKVEIYK